MGVADRDRLGWLMPAFTPIRQFPFPIDSDLQNVASAIETLARSVDDVTGTETVRRYPSVAARDSVNPVPQEGQRCYCVIGPGVANGFLFVGRGGTWWPQGLSLFCGRTSTVSIVADATYQVIPWQNNFWDVGNRLGGTGVWTAPFKGFVRITVGCTLVVETPGTGIAALGDFHGILAYSYNGVIGQLHSFYGRFGHLPLHGTTVASVNAGDQISIQAWVNAIGFSKSLHFGGGDVTGFCIEYL